MKHLILRYGRQFLHEPAGKKLGFHDFMKCLRESPSVKWCGKVEGGNCDYLNPETSGCFLISEEIPRFLCYEYLDGIAVHIEGSVQAIIECNRVANLIECRMYFT